MKRPLEEWTVADVMQPAVKTVSPTMLLPDLEDQLLADRVSGFPVVENQKLVGVVSRSDIVRQLSVERDIAEHVSDFYFDERDFYVVETETIQSIADRVGERMEGLTVGDVMARNPLTAHLDQPIRSVAKRFVDQHIHRLPVTDGGTLVGIITTTDLVRLIADGRIV